MINIQKVKFYLSLIRLFVYSFVFILPLFPTGIRRITISISVGLLTRASSSVITTVIDSQSFTFLVMLCHNPSYISLPFHFYLLIPFLSSFHSISIYIFSHPHPVSPSQDKSNKEIWFGALFVYIMDVNTTIQAKS